jgi:type II secretory pathway component PulF
VSGIIWLAKVASSMPWWGWILLGIFIIAIVFSILAIRKHIGKKIKNNASSQKT